MWTWIIQTITPTELMHNWLQMIPNMLDTAWQMLTTPAMTVIIIIGLIVWFLIWISK
mgnify:CR=1 FL=1